MYTIHLPAFRYAPLAQLDRVAHYECEGWGFESLMAHHIENAEISKVSAFFIALDFVKKCKKIRLNGAK